MRRPHANVALLIFGLPLIMSGAQPSAPQANPGPKIDWQFGPGVAHIGDQAQMEIPAGDRFSGAAGAKTFLELTQNIPSGKEVGVLLPKDLTWFVVFEFEDVGYVKDDEKKSLDAGAMLSSIKTNTDRANQVRRQNGWDSITVLGWIQPPHYNEVTHHLEWSTRAEDSKGKTFANYNTRYLGRRGVMSVGLVSEVDQLDTDLAGFRQVMGGFQYTPQNNYKAFVKGDKVAEYGLTALVVGGAAAVATKVGLFKYLWKLLLVGWKLVVAALAGLGAALKRLFTRGKKTPDPVPGPDPDPAQQQP